MPEWTRDKVEERLTEAAAVLSGCRAAAQGTSAPGRRSTHREGDRRGDADAQRLPPPSTSAITRMEEAITWNRFLEPDEAHLMWARAEGVRWKELCYRFGISRPTAHRRWEYALSLIAWRLNGPSKNRKRSRAFLVERTA